MNFKISLEDLEMLEEIIFGCDIIFTQPWSSKLIRDLEKFWNDMKNEMDGGFGFALPSFFKKRLTTKSEY